MPFATLTTLTLHYQTQGPSDGTPLVFINSLGTDFRIWDALVTHFAADPYYIVRYDEPGHGLSDTPPAGYTIHHHAETLLELMNTLNLTSAILIGISMGGQIAQDLAIHHPHRVQALVLCDTAAKLGMSELWNQRINGIREGGMEAVTPTILARWFAPSYPKHHPADYAGYHNMLSRMPADGYIAACEAIRDADLRDQVAAIQLPTLVLCGTEDAATTTDTVQSLAAAIPNARFAAIDAAGHLPCIEQPAAMSSLIHQFFEDNSL